MRLLDGTLVQGDVSAISFGAKFRGQGKYANGAPISGGNGGDAGMIAPVPAAYFHVPFGENDNMHFGASLTVPFGFKTEYDRDWVGRYNGVKTELQAIDLGVAFSYDVNPYLSFGASVFAERLNVDLTSAVDTGTAINATAQRTAAARVGCRRHRSPGCGGLAGRCTPGRPARLLAGHRRWLPAHQGR
jgi:long-chain fatty acid transport protein